MPCGPATIRCIPAGLPASMLEHNFLNRAFKNDFVRRVIDRTKAVSGAGYRRRVGIE